MKFKPISISLSPNVEPDDVKLAWHLLLHPWMWRRGGETSLLESEFSARLGVKHAVSFNSGRSAFFAILKALSLPKKSPVALQAFTCNALINPILWADFSLCYIDCNETTYNLDINELKKKVSADCRVLVVQHTFGLPADMEAVMQLARERNLTVVEDCAHALGAEFRGQQVGTFGNAAFFSFSRDKVVSSVYGGMAVTNDDALAGELRRLQKEFGQPSAGWVVQQLLHPVLLCRVILPLYAFFDLGKLMLIFAQLAHVLSKAVSWKEKQGKRPNYFPRALPNALAALARRQLQKMDRFQAHRQKLAQYYFDQLQQTAFGMPDMSPGQSWLRFTVTHPKAHQIIYAAWHRENILLGDWYTSVIAPADTNLQAMRYQPGRCPVAEQLARRTLNLPTHINISQREAERIVAFLMSWK